MTNTKVKRGTDTRDIQASVSASLTNTQILVLYRAIAKLPVTEETIRLSFTLEAALRRVGVSNVLG